MVALPDFLLVGAPKAGAGGRLPARLRAREVPDRPRLGARAGNPDPGEGLPGVGGGPEPLPGCAAEPPAGGVGAEPLAGVEGRPP